MPQLIAAAVVGAVAFAGYRWVTARVAAARDAAERAAARHRAEAAQASAVDRGMLVLDPDSGEYRPRS